MNNLYGGAQSKALPVGDNRFPDEEETSWFDPMSVADDSPIGYVVECDLAYPPSLHDDHSDYPLAPEHLVVTAEMHSPCLLYTSPSPRD